MHSIRIKKAVAIVASNQAGPEALRMTTKPKKPGKKPALAVQTSGILSSRSEEIFSPSLLRDIRLLIEGARGRAAAALNSEVVTLYRSIGERIRKDIPASERAAYGEQIVDALSRQLSEEYGRGFTERESLLSCLMLPLQGSELPDGRAGNFMVRLWSSHGPLIVSQAY